MSIKFEVGKEYVTRGGEVVRCTSVTESHNEYPVRVERLDGPGFTVAKNGSFFISGTPDMSDLISEHRAAEPMPTDEAQIVHMVERFLNWKLPETFNPDGGISFKKTFNENTPFPAKHEPMGTNLFDYGQAKAMVLHMLEGAPGGGVIDEIAAERRRQIEVEGWTPEHDDGHRDGQLSSAAIAYAGQATAAIQALGRGRKPINVEKYRSILAPKFWPWAASWWKPKDPRRDLIRAAALIVAEIERLDRLDERNRLDREG